MELRGWMIYGWVALPTVMYGGYALLGLLTSKEALTPFRRTWFRAGHAHAGVLLVMALVYFQYMQPTSVPAPVKHLGSGLFVVGVVAQSGGFFIHMLKGEADKRSMGTTVTTCGAILLTAAIGILVYALAVAPS
jgi:hypothetical protein